MARETIRDFGGKILGYVDTMGNGDKTVYNFYNQILGYYKKAQNITTDFYGTIIARGDAAVGLIFSDPRR